MFVILLVSIMITFMFKIMYHLLSGSFSVLKYFTIDILLTVNLSSDALEKLKIYKENFEKAYVEATEGFYRTQAAAYLQENGVQNYMKYVCTCIMHHVIYLFSLTLF